MIALALAATSCTRIGTSTGAPGSNQLIPGVVRIAQIGPLDTLVTELAGNAGSSDAAMFWGGWLFLVDDRGELVPDLATQVPTLRNGGISRDGLTITYHLRKGVQWQDGAPFDARDVLFSYHAIMNPSNNIVSRAGYDDIASMSAHDPYTVVVRLKKPFAPAIATFFAPGQSPYSLLPQHILGSLPNINQTAFARKPIGTGPFIVTRYVPGMELDFEANPHYWRGPPKLKEVRWLLVPDANTAAVMMKTGEADIFPYMPKQTVAQLQATPGVHVERRPWNQFEFIGFNLVHPPLDDVRMRQALAMAIDRPMLVRDILHGAGTVANGDQPPFGWAFDPRAQGQPFDPAAAQRALDQLGWQVGGDGIRTHAGRRLSFALVYSQSDVDAVRFGPVVQEAFRRIGVEITLKAFPNSLYYATKQTGGILNAGKFDLAAEGWIGGVDPDNSALYSCAGRPPNGYNNELFCDAVVDAQIALTLTQYDRAQRRAAYWQIQERLNEQLPMDFLYWSDRSDAVRDGLHGFDPAPTVTPWYNVWNLSTD